MPFLPPNHQRQSTEGINTEQQKSRKWKFCEIFKKFPVIPAENSGAVEFSDLCDEGDDENGDEERVAVHSGEDVVLSVHLA